MDQLELFAFPASNQNRITVTKAFELLWRHHLGCLPSGRPFNSNRKALCKSFGHVYFDALTEPEIVKHIHGRTQSGVGPQTIRHDIKLIVLLYNALKRWKHRKYRLDDFDTSQLLLPEDDPTHYIKRPRTTPRKKIVLRDEFAKWIEHCPERLKMRTFFSIDTGLSPIDLKNLRPKQYNAYNDCLEIQRHKSGEVESIPVTDRCRTEILKAIKAKQEFVLNWTNHDKEVKQVRKNSGVYFWFGRDLRKTYANRIYKLSNHDVKMVQKALIQRDPRTAQNHYIIETGDDLRPLVKTIEKEFC